MASIRIVQVCVLVCLSGYGRGLVAPIRSIRSVRGPSFLKQGDEAYMREAVELAKLGLGKTAPNPAVGCLVLSANGTVVGRGFHPAAGEPHAEIFALRDAGVKLSAGKDDTRWKVSEAGHLSNATLYVTLEPCSHVGRTPPCCDAIIDIGVARVVVGMEDPAPWVSGRGIERMRASGISVEVGIEEEACKLINAEWIANLTIS